MSNIVEFEDPNSDLEHPLWFYKACGKVSDEICLEFSDMLNAHHVSGDHVFEAAADVPPRLMALMEGDQEVVHFVHMAVLNMSFALSIAEDEKYGRKRVRPAQSPIRAH